MAMKPNQPRRIAYCSPVNPAPSGISDYSEELLPYLGQYADVTLYVDDGLTPSNAHLSRHLHVAPLRRLERDHRRAPYDALLYHIGNSPAHMGIWRVAQRIPGIVVMHDFVLHHFMLSYAAHIEHDVQHYVRMMVDRYGEAGSHIAQLMIRGRFTEAAFDFPCCEPVVAAADGLIAHSRYVQSRVQALRPDLPTAVVPMGIPLPPTQERDAARRQLGLPPDGYILASFGHINAYKRLEQVFRALRALLPDIPHIHYVLVGSVSPNYDLHGLIQRMGLESYVSSTGYVSAETFAAYVAAADVCLNLRHPTAGETSASLLRLLGAGRPTLVTATGSFAELPPHVVAHVDNDEAERDLITAYCRLFAHRPDIARALGREARNYVATHHRLDEAARGYMHVLAQCYAWAEGVPEPFHPAPLWEPGDIQSAQQPAQQLAQPAQPAQPAQSNQSNQLAAEPSSLEHLPPLHPHTNLAELATLLVESGITEHDTTVLQTIAEQLWELTCGYS